MSLISRTSRQFTCFLLLTVGSTGLFFPDALRLNRICESQRSPISSQKTADSASMVDASSRCSSRDCCSTPACCCRNKPVASRSECPDSSSLEGQLTGQPLCDCQVCLCVSSSSVPLDSIPSKPHEPNASSWVSLTMWTASSLESFEAWSLRSGFLPNRQELVDWPTEFLLDTFHLNC